MIRDIFNYLGDKIGELELPDNTSEEAWAEAIAAYAAVPPAPIIPDVTPRQFRQALIISGIPLSAIEAAINSQAEPTKSLAMVEWEYSIAFKRDNPLVNQMAPSLGFTSEMLDNLWLLAASL